MRLPRRLAFPPATESRYRYAQKSRYRLPRAFFFSATALAVIFAPLYNQTLFRVSPEILTQVLFVELLWVFPAALLAAISVWRDWPEHVSSRIQLFGVLSIWGGVLALYFYSHMGLMSYPHAITPVAVLAVAVFGGYRALPTIAAGSVVLLLDIAIVAHFAGEALVVGQRAYELLFVAIVAIGGTLTADLLSRQLWLNQQESMAMARIDPLTGLANRTAFLQWLDRIVASAYRERCAVAVALVDLDHFKAVNDRYGHFAGDEVLRAAAGAIASSAARRPLDLCARYGGDEFAVVWYDVRPERMQVLIDQVRDAVAAARRGAGVGDRDLELGASVGVVCAIPERRDIAETLLRHADRLLYQAKGAGRNQAAIEMLEGPGLAAVSHSGVAG